MPKKSLHSKRSISSTARKLKLSKQKQSRTMQSTPKKSLHSKGIMSNKSAKKSKTKLKLSNV